MTQAKSTNIEQQMETSLTIDNPKVRQVAEQLGWSPLTVVTRTQKALESQLEREIYLEIAIERSMEPETANKIFRSLFDQQLLQISDLKDRIVGENLKTNKLWKLGDFLDQVLQLMTDYNISTQDACSIVHAYGDNVEIVLNSINVHIEFFAERFKIEYESDAKAMGIALAVLADTIIPFCESEGVPYFFDVVDYFALIDGKDKETYGQYTSFDEEEV
jgi:DNA-binding transcriptional regulator YhcF (GntR family)